MKPIQLDCHPKVFHETISLDPKSLSVSQLYAKDSLSSKNNSMFFVDVIAYPFQKIWGFLRFIFQRVCSCCFDQSKGPRLKMFYIGNPMKDFLEDRTQRPKLTEIIEKDPSVILENLVREFLSQPTEFVSLLEELRKKMDSMKKDPTLNEYKTASILEKVATDLGRNGKLSTKNTLKYLLHESFGQDEENNLVISIYRLNRELNLSISKNEQAQNTYKKIYQTYVGNPVKDFKADPKKITEIRMEYPLVLVENLAEEVLSRPKELFSSLNALRAMDIKPQAEDEVQRAEIDTTKFFLMDMVSAMAFSGKLDDLAIKKRFSRSPYFKMDRIAIRQRVEDVINNINQKFAANPQKMQEIKKEYLASTKEFNENNK